MDSFIIIDGLALWVSIILFVAILAAYEYTIYKRNAEIKQLRKENEKLKIEVCRLEHKLYKATFTVPELEEKNGIEVNKNGRK
jgi:heme/copper-type cytochrome/quinol oxidase subunit 2